MKNLKVVPVIVFFGIAGLFVAALKWGDPSRLPSMMIGKMAPKSEFPAIDGLALGGKTVAGFSSANFANGKVSIVNYWASWCAECLDEHEHLKTLKEASGADLYGVAYKDTPDSVRRYLARYGNPFNYVGEDPAGRTGIDWGVYGVPETYIIDGEGRVVYKQIGPMTPETIETTLLPAIRKAQAAKAPG